MAERDGGGGAINYSNCGIGVFPACSDDEGGLEGVIAGELTGTVEVLLQWSRIREKKLCGCEGTKRNYAAANQKKKQFTRLQRQSPVLLGLTGTQTSSL